MGGAFLMRGDEERARYLELLGPTFASRSVHGQQPLERLLKPVHTGFALWLHRRRGRRKRQGPVFADRPRRVLVQEDAYLLQLIRYVHNNPVRAGVARDAASASIGWSSHRAYVGLAEPPEWLKVGYVLERFSKRPALARHRFDEFVREGVAESRRADLVGDGSEPVIERAREVLGDGWRLSDPIVGDAEFARRVASDVRAVQGAFAGGELGLHRKRQMERPLVREVVDAVCAALELDPWEFENRPKASKSALARQLSAWIWIHHLGGKQVELARELRAGTWAVTRWYGRAVALAPELEELAAPVLNRWRRAGGRRQARGQTSRVHYHISVVD